MSNELFIIAAGKGSRMNHNKPKALMEIDGVPNVLRTIALTHDLYDRISVVISRANREAWDENYDLFSKYEKVQLVPIDSGLGDGDAVYRALSCITMEKTFSTIVWGDTVFSGVRPFADAIHNAQYVAVTPSDNPYVNIVVDDSNYAECAQFSKFGEVDGPGLHDQSLFVYETHLLSEALFQIRSSTFRNGKYDLPGGEMSLLYTLNWFSESCYGPMKAVIYDKAFAHSYNTIEEYEVINAMYS